MNTEHENQTPQEREGTVNEAAGAAPPETGAPNTPDIPDIPDTPALDAQMEELQREAEARAPVEGQEVSTDFVEDAPQGGEAPQNDPDGTDGPVPPPELSGGLPVAAQPSLPQVQEPKGGKSRKPLILALAAVVVLVGAGIAIFFGTGQNIRMERKRNPEQYLKNAVASANEAISSGEAYGVNLPAFREGDAVAQDFDVTLQTGVGGVLPEEVLLSGSYMADPWENQFRLDLSVTAGFLNFRDNRLYFSPDLIAVSAPTVFSGAEYITLYPETLKEDWEESLLGIVPLPDRDYREMVAGVMGGGRERIDELNRSMAEQTAGAAFADEGYITEVVDGKEQELSVMTYTWTPEQSTGVMQTIVQAWADQMKSYYSVMGITGGYYYNDADMDEFLEEFEGVRFLDPLVLRYTINDRRELVGLDMEKCRVLLYEMEEYDYRYEMALGMKIRFEGGERPTDAIRLTMEIFNEDDDLDYDFTALLSGANNEGTWNTRLEVDAGSWYGDNRYESILNANMEWTPDMEGQNARLRFTVFDGFDETEVTLTGHLDDHDGGMLELTGGTLTIRDDYGEEYTCRLDYKLYPMRSEDVRIDVTDSVKFSELEMSDILAIRDSLEAMDL